MSSIEEIEQLEDVIGRAFKAACSDNGTHDGGSAQYWTQRAQTIMSRVKQKVEELEVERDKAVRLMLKTIEL